MDLNLQELYPGQLDIITCIITALRSPTDDSHTCSQAVKMALRSDVPEEGFVEDQECVSEIPCELNLIIYTAFKNCITQGMFYPYLMVKCDVVIS